MHLTAALFLAAVLLGSCNYRSEPEQAIHTYAGAVGDGRCDDALKFMSVRTRHAIEVLRVKPQHPQNPLPIEQYYCNKLTFEDCKLGKMTVIDQQADTAKVSMPCGRTQDGILPGFSSPFLKYEPRTTELVREDGEWHIVEPFVVRMIEIREKEDQMREVALRDQERRRLEYERNKREGTIQSTSGNGEIPHPPSATSSK